MKKENTYKISYNNIENYYREIGNNVLKKLIYLCDNNKNCMNFIELSIRYNIYLFKKKKKKWINKPIKQIVNECKNKKKTFLRKYADKVIIISKSDMSDTCIQIDKYTKNLELHIKNIDNLIRCIQEDNNILFNCLLHIFDEDNINNNIIQLDLDFIAEYTN
jgi:hypothetical protein